MVTSGTPHKFPAPESYAGTDPSQPTADRSDGVMMSRMRPSLEDRAAIMTLTSKMATCAYPTTDDRSDRY